MSACLGLTFSIEGRGQLDYLVRKFRRMIRVGPAGYPEGSKGPRDAVERTRAEGFAALEMQFVRQARMQQSAAEEAGRRAKELGLGLSAHAPYYINFNSANPETVEKSKEWVMKTVRIAHWLGARIIVMHAGSYKGRDVEGCTKAVIEGLRVCRATMEDEGVDDVLLGLETGGKKVAWGMISEVREVMAEVDGVCPVIDFAHLHARSGGGLRTREDFDRVLDEYEEVHHGPLHAHFSCIEFTEAGERRHLSMETKQPDLSLLARSLKGRKIEATLISETPEPTEGAKGMMNLLEGPARRRVKVR